MTKTRRYVIRTYGRNWKRPRKDGKTSLAIEKASDKTTGILSIRLKVEG